ncbi:cupin domain-containing protein [Colwellia sp. C1TZA3]|uniref:cupin domain-containing protein n=1 Tax=Colwellia sp. C1TZA3 TaxID=2508879 RepID=UPI001749F040|nr:cupin domain-containing protein [Colwellia sp. C1TZA3]
MVSACSSLNIATNTLEDDSATASNKNIQSGIISFENTHKTPYEASVFHTYFYGETIGTKDTIVGLAVIEANNEIHPPHQHAEEEYLYIVEGSGEWTLNGVKTPAKKGDVLYVAPWDVHGIFNTGNVPMKFFITRASSKGVEIKAPIDSSAADKK